MIILKIIFCCFFLLLTSCVGGGGGTKESDALHSDLPTDSQQMKVDGGWSRWQLIQDCSLVQKQQVYQRECNNPLAQNGGLPCEGSSRKIIQCSSIPTLSEWYAEGICNQQTGKQLYRRICYNGGGSTLTCDASLEEWRDCAVNGSWTDWQISIPCDSSRGVVVYERFCSNPVPLNGGQTCRGASLEYRACPIAQQCVWVNDGGCTAGQQSLKCLCNGNVLGACENGLSTKTIACANSGAWGDWQAYPANNCDAKTGMQLQVRSCLGSACVGSTQRLVTCPVNCTYSAWRMVGSCSASGLQHYIRDTIPEKNGGIPCREVIEKDEACSVNCRLTDNWVDESECSAETGTMTQKRATVPLQNDGKPCPDVSMTRTVLCVPSC